MRTAQPVVPARVVLVFAHPCEESLGAVVRSRVREALVRDGHQVRDIDLYASGFAPGRPLPDDQREALDWAETLVLVHPTWWSGQPAILVAWLAAAAEHGLADIHRLVTVTTHGGRRIANVVAGESGRHVVGRAFRRRCAPDAKFRWVALYGLDRDRPADRAMFLARIDREIGRLVS